MNDSFGYRHVAGGGLKCPGVDPDKEFPESWFCRTDSQCDGPVIPCVDAAPGMTETSSFGKGFFSLFDFSEGGSPAVEHGAEFAVGIFTDIFS